MNNTSDIAAINRAAPSPSEALEEARALCEAGRLHEATLICRDLVDAQPQNTEALHLLGALLNQQCEFRTAAEVMERAARSRPNDPVLRNNLGNALKDAGRAAEAEKAYRQALKRRPDYSDAHSNLGCLLHSLGRFKEAEQSLRKALAFDPAHAAAYNHLGMVLADLGQPKQAVASFHRALEIRPDFGQAHNNLVTALLKLRHLADAEQSCREWLALLPDAALGHSTLAYVLRELGRLDEAEQSCRHALSLDGTLVTAHLNLAVILQELGRFDEAEYSCRSALALDSRSAAVHCVLGNVLLALGRREEAECGYREALAIDPAMVTAHSNLGNLLRDRGELDEAERSCRRALELDPSYAIAYSNLGNVLMVSGRLEEAESAYRHARTLDSSWSGAYTNLALLLNYIPRRTPAQIYAEHQEFGRRFGPRGEPPAYSNVREPGRLLRVGYVSGDLRNHSVAFFIEPTLAKHDRREVEVVCYHNHPLSDGVTRRLQSYADRWHQVFGLNDDALAELIRSDAIDVLIDLSGHTANNRLLTFARKPAPVQATWLGYLNTTGLEAMDWRITDARACPEGLLDNFHTEKLWRLPDSQWCYQPPERCPELAPLPSATCGGFTFAVLSTPAKTNAQMLEVWRRLLDRTPGSRLLIVTSTVNSIPAVYREQFAAHGISPERLELMPSRSFEDYLALHGTVDVMLDTFPYTGGTTTCHALWMGVPVVSLVGDTATSRGGASILHAVGLPELVAQTPDQYIGIAADLAADRERLASLRAGMRERMRASPLMDAERFTRNLENAYRTMWRTWCQTQAS